MAVLSHGGRGLLLLAVLVWSALLAWTAQAQRSREYEIEPRLYDVEAVFLFNFAQYVRWPETAFPNGDSPFVIGILGEPKPLLTPLRVVTRNETVRDRKFKVEPYGKVEEVGLCHILFISQSEESRLSHILRALQGRPVLTVSEIQGFVRRGGMIEFFIENAKVGMRINNECARSVHLSISPRLLRLAAQVVDSEVR